MSSARPSSHVTMTPDKKIEEIWPGEFDPRDHYYPRVLDSELHPTLVKFLELTHEQLVSRYCQLHPRVCAAALKKILEYTPKHLHWAGVDLVHATSRNAKRELVVIETNSCPSGQKSMPLHRSAKPQGGYRMLIEEVFAPLEKLHADCQGELAVIYDKNYIEASGYARAMADYYDSRVFLVPYYEDQSEVFLQKADAELLLRHNGMLIPIRAALRYLTQRPWNRLPIKTKTLIVNPLISCLAGGRNKQAASLAYDLFNTELLKKGLKINFPETVRGVEHTEIPQVVQRFGGQAVIKVPYTNAGQGVYPITSELELMQFVSEPQYYQRFVVQSLIGHRSWSASQSKERLYQVGTVADRDGQVYVADLRIMLGATPLGFKPIALYARRARQPLSDHLGESSTREMLVTNLSIRSGCNSWEAETGRLILMDRDGFEQLGLGIDELIKGFVQAVLATTAIDKLSVKLLTEQGRLRQSLFRSINNDPALLSEIFPEENSYAHLVSLAS